MHQIAPLLNGTYFSEVHCIQIGMEYLYIKLYTVLCIKIRYYAAWNVESPFSKRSTVIHLKTEYSFPFTFYTLEATVSCQDS
jgi:hypothetical protein